MFTLNVQLFGGRCANFKIKGDFSENTSISMC